MYNMNTSDYIFRSFYILISFLSILSIFIIPVAVVEIQFGFNVLSVSVVETLTLFDSYKYIYGNKSINIMLFVFSSFIMGSIIVSLGALYEEIAIFGSSIQIIALLIFALRIIFNSHSSGSEIGDVHISPRLGLYIVVLLPFVALIFSILDYYWYNNITRKIDDILQEYN